MGKRINCDALKLWAYLTSSLANDSTSKLFRRRELNRRPTSNGRCSKACSLTASNLPCIEKYENYQFTSSLSPGQIADWVSNSVPRVSTVRHFVHLAVFLCKCRPVRSGHA